MSAGDRSCAISTSGASMASSAASRSCCGLALAARRRRRQHGGPALHVAQHALDHLLQVGLALAQVLVLHLVELARHHFQLRGQRPLGVVEALGDPVLDAAGQLLVLQQHQVHVEQRRSARAARRWGPSARCWPAGGAARRPPRCAPTRTRSISVSISLGLDEVVRHVDAAGHHQHRAPDGDAAGDSEAVDRQGHGAALHSPSPNLSFISASKASIASCSRSPIGFDDRPRCRCRRPASSRP